MIFVIIGLILGFILGTIQFILGDTAFGIISSLIGLYLVYLFFRFFGLVWGLIIIVVFLLFLLGGIYDIVSDVGDSIMSFFR